MALARGGDQVVLKDADSQAKPQFFGGQTEGTIRRTRTRSRAMSTSLKKIFFLKIKRFLLWDIVIQIWTLLVVLLV